MKKIFGMVLALGLAASPALAQKVTIDYAHEFDYKSIKTFTYVDNPESGTQSPLMASRIAALIKEKLTSNGKQEVPEGGDIYVIYHVTAQEETSFTTTDYGYGGGYWGGYRGWGGGMSTTTAQTYIEGTLIIDAYDGKEKKMIWRATGTVTVKEDPEKQVKQVEKILDKIGDKWKKILAGQGK